MGRGRRSIINQSVKRKKSDLVMRKNESGFARIGDKKIIQRISIPCEFIETLKKMDPKLVARSITPC
jgi:hypothetical protein